MPNPCPNDPLCAKQLKLDSVALTPKHVEPGVSMRLGVGLKNFATFISPTDPDSCPISLNSRGYSVKIHLSTSWGTNRTRTECIPQTDLTGVPTQETIAFDVTAPSQKGQHTIDVHLELPGGNKVQATAPLTASLEVSDQGQGGVPGDKASRIMVNPNTVASEIKPNTEVPAIFNVQNTAGFIQSNDPDYCSQFCATGGYSVNAITQLGSSTEANQTKCICGGGGKMMDLSFMSPPDPGTYTVDFEFRFGQTQQYITEVTREINVSKDAPDPPKPPEDGGDGGFFDGGNGGNTAINTVIRTVGPFVLGAVAIKELVGDD